MRLSVVLSWLCAVLLAAAAHAQTVDNVLLVINESSAASIQIGDYYAKKRGVASDHIVTIKTAAIDTIARQGYEREIEVPIASRIQAGLLQDKILYIVLTKGVPIRIAGSEGQAGTVSSVDSELTLLYRKMLGIPTNVSGPAPNPYFLADRDLKEAKPFTRSFAEIYLVTRLDAFTVDEAIRLIDRGSSPSSDGKFVLDQKATMVDAGGDRWLGEAATRLQASGLGGRVLLENTKAVASSPDPVIGYASWGSNDPSNRLRDFGLRFADGAVAAMFVSTDGRSFAEPPANWLPGGPPSPSGAQSLIGDLIRAGVTGVAGHVSEPYLNATVRPQILFPAYAAGFNLAESFYLAMPFLSWQTVVVGDPLCAPFPRQAIPTDALSPGIDAKTELPALFSNRRLDVMARSGLNREAFAMILKSESRLQAGDTKEFEALLVRATDLEPRLDAVNLRLAFLYEERGDFANAIERYRRVVASDAKNATALNNLAYGLAVRQNAPKEALPFAQRAFQISGTPVVADTLAWIHHLLGDDIAALPLINKAAMAANSAEIWVHAAFIHAALNDPAQAAKDLDAAEKLDAKLVERSDIKALRDRLRQD